MADTHVLAEPPVGSFALMGYAGIGLRSTDEAESFSQGGFLLRGQYSYATLGAFADVGESGANRSQRFGGFAGAFLPIYHWVDLELGLGLSRRIYVSDDKRFGLDGYEVETSNFDLRVGLSDRAGGLFGGRVGGCLAFDYDLAPEDRAWSYASIDPTNPSSTGSTRVGGLAVVLMFTVGLDVTPQPAVEASAAPAAQPARRPWLR